MTQSRFILTFMVCLAALQLLIHLSLIVRGVGFIVSRVTLDDTYYYVQTAWNVRVYGFPTFDGINSTNGVQFFWFWLMAALAFLVPSKQVLLFLVLILCALLDLSGYFAVWRIYRRIRYPVMTLIMACSWFYLTARFPYYLSAMENSLHALAFWLLLLQILAAIEDIQNKQSVGKRFTAVTLLSVWVVWIRLDSVIYTAPLYLYLEWRLLREVAYRKMAPRLIAVMLPVILFSASVLFLGYYYMGGSFIPVSGLVKSDQFALDNGTANWLIRSVIRGFRLTFPVELWRLFVHQPDNFFPPMAGERVIGLITIGMFGLALLLVQRLGNNSLLKLANEQQRGRTDLDRFRGLYATLLVANAIYILYYSSGGINSTYAVWYLSPFFIFCLVTGAIVVEKVLDKLPIAHQNTLRGLAVVTMLIACLGLTSATFYHLVGTPYDVGEQYTRIAVARWMRENTDTKTIFAAWNAGALGFLSDRRVINLDGLINNNEYYQSVLAAGRIAPGLYSHRLLNYLNEKNVTFVIDNQAFIADAIKSHYILEKTFPIEGGAGAIEVYRNPYVNLP